MSFFDRSYLVFVVLGDPASPKLWEASHWGMVEKLLEGFATGVRGKASLRTIQYGAAGRSVSFGRLGWSSKSSEKWTHSAETQPHVHFLSAEAWTPSWTVCEREGLAPDFYVDLLNENRIGQQKKSLLFNQRFICALSLDQGISKLELLANAMAELAAYLSAPVFARTTRKWGVVFGGGGGFTSAIQDMAIGHLFKPGDPHARPLDASSFSESWEFLRAREI